MPRRQIPQKIIDRLMDAYNYTCVYCGEPATDIDHVIPWAYVLRHEISNLVPACHDCNLIASDKMFLDIESKREYILYKRGLPKWSRKLINRRSICTECGLPFKPRANGSTIFLCTHCTELADMELGEREAALKELKEQIMEYANSLNEEPEEE